MTTGVRYTAAGLLLLAAATGGTVAASHPAHAPRPPAITNLRPVPIPTVLPDAGSMHACQLRGIDRSQALTDAQQSTDDQLRQVGLRAGSIDGWCKRHSIA